MWWVGAALSAAALQPPPSCVGAATGAARTGHGAVTFINPLEVDGFAEPGGWGGHADPSKLPLLVFLPGMDGSFATPFMQFAEVCHWLRAHHFLRGASRSRGVRIAPWQLGTTFELACLQHTEGLASRVSFDELTASCAEAVAGFTAEGRQVLLVGESFGATLALAVAHELQERCGAPPPGVRGVMVVNPATSYRRSALATVGPLCASFAGPLLAPLYALSLFVFSAYILTPAYQAPSLLATITAQKATELNNNPYREAFVGRVAMGAYLGQRSEQLAIGPLLAINVFDPDDLRFRLEQWLGYGADLVNSRDVVRELKLPMQAVVGDLDRLLPSMDEAERLRDACGPERWRGTSVVQGAGHASTLGNRVDLLHEIRRAFADDFAPPLRPRVDLVGRAEHPGDAGSGWERGLVDRTYEALDPADYTQMNRGGRLYPNLSR